MPFHCDHSYYLLGKQFACGFNKPVYCTFLYDSLRDLLRGRSWIQHATTLNNTMRKGEVELMHRGSGKYSYCFKVKYLYLNVPNIFIRPKKFKSKN